MNFDLKSKDISNIEINDFIDYDKIKKKNKILLFIDDNGETKILINEYGDKGDTHYNKILSELKDNIKSLIQ